jgi:hypothetical protein
MKPDGQLMQFRALKNVLFVSLLSLAATIARGDAVSELARFPSSTRSISRSWQKRRQNGAWSADEELAFPRRSKLLRRAGFPAQQIEALRRWNPDQDT